MPLLLEWEEAIYLSYVCLVETLFLTLLLLLLLSLLLLLLLLSTLYISYPLAFHSWRKYPTLSQPTLLLNRDSHRYEGSVVQNSFTSPADSHSWKPGGGMLASHSRIIVGAIHNGENISLHEGIEPRLPRWELATTTTMLPDVTKS